MLGVLSAPVPPTYGADASAGSLDTFTNVNTRSDLAISTRPEIRKGCSWDIYLRFAPELKLASKRIWAEKPRQIAPSKDLASPSQIQYYLCLKVHPQTLRFIM
jgi:hypothetical protein